MRLLLAISLLLSFYLSLTPGRARADDSTPSQPDACTVTPDGSKVQVRYPELSSHRNLDFWQIPWKSGDKISGAIQVETTEPLPNLTIRMIGGAASMDKASRRIIPAGHVMFARTDQGSPSADGQTELAGPTSYVYHFTADEVPGEDTYCARLEAVWGEAGHTVRQTLPSLKLKAFSDATVRILSGNHLQAQWTNLDAPLTVLAPVEPFLSVRPDVYFSRYNPEPTLSFTMPGNPNVDSTQEFDVEVSMDPVLNDKDTPTPLVSFWIEREQTLRPEMGAAVQRMKVGLNDSFRIHVFRKHTVVGDRLLAPRIPPGKYHSTITIRTPWGSRQESVEITVRDAPLWPALALIFGVLVSLLALYWERRQPLFQAQVKARRWRRFYVLQGIRLSLVEWVLARVNLSVSAGEVADAVRAADLLEDVLHSMPDTLLLEGVIAGLLSLPQVSAAVIAAEMVGASTLAEARERLGAFCAVSADPALQEMATHLAQNSGYGAVRPAPMPEVKPLEFARWTLREWMADLFIGIRRSATRIFLPSMWDAVTMVVFFVLVNGGMIALQMVEVYGTNEVFGSPTDYLNLLFWGFAGDTTRNKLTDLAGKVMPTGRLPDSPQGAQPNSTSPPASK